MKKSGVLHNELAQIIASLGHGDLLVIGDAGLPVPQGEIGQQIDVRVTTEQISHDAFKTRCAGARAIVRTGEATPHANVGLVAGVAF